MIRGPRRIRSIARMTMPPTISATHTTVGVSNRISLMYLCSHHADHGRRQEGDEHRQR